MPSAQDRETVGDQSRPMVPMDQVVANELEICGSHGIQAFRYRELFAMIRAGKLAPEKLIHGTITLEESTDALAGMNNFSWTGIKVIDRF